MIFAKFYGLNDRGEVIDAIITQKDNVVTLTNADITDVWAEYMLLE